MSPDDILEEYCKSGVKIKVTELDDSILIEATRDALIFLSKLLCAQAEADSDEFSISPFGAGNSWFSDGSTKGIYIQRVND